MADSNTRLTIELEVLLRNLDRSLRGLDQVKRKLESIAAIKPGTRAATAGVDRQAAAAQRVAQQQERAAIRTQQLASAQTRAQQTTQRLAIAQQRLDAATAKTTAGLTKQADHHVKAFRAIEAASRQATQRIIGIGNALRSVGQGLASTGATLTASLTVPLIGLSAATVNAAAQLDSLKRGLTAITGSSEEAGRQLQRLTQLAKLPGIGFEEAIQGSIRLQAVGFSAKEAERNLREFANAVALTGGGREELSRVTVQLGQLAAKGKVLSQDLRPIIEAAPAVGRALKQAFGTVNADDIAEMTGSSKEFLNVLVTELEKLPRAAAGAKNSFENFRDTLFRSAALLGDTVLPALTRFVDVVGPAINSLAVLFGALSTPTKVLIITVGVLAAALGPVLFIVGQLTLGAGRLLVGFAQLNALGIGPTIANLRALITGSLSAAAAQRTLAASMALVAGIAGAVVAGIGLIITAFAVYKAFQKDSITLSREQVDALDDQVKGLKQQAEFLNGLKTGVARTADEQDRLLEIYEKLNTQAKVRVTGISDEEKRLGALREELGKLIALREQERVQQAASLAGELANNLLRVKVNEDERNSIAGRIQANAGLIETLEREQVINAATTRALAERGITASTVQDAIGALKTESESLSDSQDELIKSGKELNDTAKEQAAIILALQRQTGLTARQLLVAAQSMGVFRGDIETTLKTLERYVAQTEDATRATDEFTRTLNQQQKDLASAGEQADQEAKRRRSQISAAASLARESADSFESALKFLNAFIAAQPRLRADIERERQIQGKSLAEFLEDALEGAFKGRAKGKSAEAIRSAQERLNDALAEAEQEATEKSIAAEKARNEQLLRLNDLRFSRELISFRQFVVERARLQREQIQGEINRQKEIARLSDEEIKRLEARAAISTGTEQIKAQADAKKALADRTQAEAKILDLQSQQREVFADTAKDLDQFNKERQESFRELSRELDEILGKEDQAAEAAINERFAEQLRELRNELKLAGQDLIKAQALGDRAGQAIAAATLEQLRNQITSINNHKRELNAVVELQAAQEQIRRAEEQQANLERELTFSVEFRGLTEEEAIRKRLEGEAKIRDAIQQQQVRLEILIATLKAAGLEIPLALSEAVERLKVASLGLGELSFSEQFRLAQQEFDRLNDERIAKIQDVERAVRNRDIAEVEGAIIIRRINGLYTADLEAQLQLLKQIATASKDRGLIQQAADAGEIVKDTQDKVASLGKQIEATGKDAFRSGLADFFVDLTDRSQTALEDLLNFLKNIVRRINETIADNLADSIFEQLFDGADRQTGGIIASIKRILGLGGEEAAPGAIGSIVGGAAESTGLQAAAATSAATLTTGATTAAAALTTGGTAASAALTTGGTSAATALTAAITAAAASFSAAVIAAGAAFAAAVGAASGTQVAAGGLGSIFGGGTTAATGMFPAIPGGVVRIVEGGYPEAVLTTDPRHAQRQVAILKAFLRETRGLGGRIRGLASGGFALPDLALNVPRVPLPSGNFGDMEISSQQPINLRNINLFDKREMVRGYLRSAEGTMDILNTISENAPDIGRRIGIR